jgi:hypothetical protein
MIDGYRWSVYAKRDLWELKISRRFEDVPDAVPGFAAGWSDSGREDSGTRDLEDVWSIVLIVLLKRFRRGRLQLIGPANDPPPE